jgi:hypothetical protein
LIDTQSTTKNKTPPTEQKEIHQLEKKRKEKEEDK